MIDADFLLAVLTDARGGWVSHGVILGRAQYQLGHGLTIHSRAPDLRKRGLRGESRVESVGGRKQSSYRLASLGEGESVSMVSEDGERDRVQNPARLAEGTSAGPRRAATLDDPSAVLASPSPAADQLPLLPPPTREYQSAA